MLGKLLEGARQRTASTPPAQFGYFGIEPCYITGDLYMNDLLLILYTSLYESLLDNSLRVF